MITLKERLGIALEHWIYAILRILFPARLGYRILHPDWNNYNNHNGVDFRVFQRNKEILAVECKNWRKIGKKYGLDVAQTEIVERFTYIGTSLKLCIISFTDVLTNPALYHIKSNGIQLIQTDKLIGHRDYKTQLFHVVKSAISKLLVQPARRSFDTSIQSKLVNTSNVLSNPVEAKQTTTIPTIGDSNVDRGEYLESIVVRPVYIEWLRYKSDVEEG